MQCPLDGETLVMTARNGVEIDYCSRCRGVWLDRGELDKIIERSTTEFSGHAQPAYQAPTGPQPRYGQKSHHEEPKSSKKPYYKKSKKYSFLEDLFDFD